MHYAVLVITEDGNYEKALEPFDENMKVEPYIKTTREELLKYCEKYCQDAPWELGEEGVLKWYCEDEYHDENYNLLSEYNPNGQWDYYTLGGRWSGCLKLNHGLEDEYTEKATESYGNVDIGDYVCDEGQVKDLDLLSSKSEKRKKFYERYWEINVENSIRVGEEINNSDYDIQYKPEYMIKTYGDKEFYVKYMTSLHVYAIVYKGEWLTSHNYKKDFCDYEKGELESQERKFFVSSQLLLANLNPEYYVAMVDVHD